MSVLNQLFSRTPDAVFAIDEMRHIIFHNSVFAQILQLPATKIIGHNCHEVVCGRALNGQRFCDSDCRVARDTVSGRTVENFDLVISKPDKQLVWLSIGACTLPQPVDNAAVIFVLRPISAIQSTSGFASSPLFLTEPNHCEKSNTLSRRERQILKLLVDGLSTEAIACALHISPLTVRRHVQNIFTKLGVHSRTEAVGFALRNHFV